MSNWIGRYAALTYTLPARLPLFSDIPDLSLNSPTAIIVPHCHQRAKLTQSRTLSLIGTITAVPAVALCLFGL